MISPLIAALDAIDRLMPEPRDEDAAVMRAKIRGLMVGYSNRWADAGWETIEIEQTFHLPIINPETSKPSRTFTHGGKYDGVIRWPASGKIMLLEHKTCSEDITDPNAPYWRRMTIDSQVSHYMLANWQDGRKLDGTLYDVLRKPAIRPKDITKADQKILSAWGTYCGHAVPIEYRTLDRENADLYEIRLIADIAERPDWYFGRRVINRLDSEVLEFSQELWDVGQTMIDARNNDRHFRNDAACNAYGSYCEYIGVCSGQESIESDKWRKVETVNGELDLGGDGRDVLTHSRLKCFAQCRRKHLYRYELGIRRREEEDREALVFGHVMHEALAAFWLCFKGDVDGYRNGCSANEVDRPDATPVAH